MSSKPTPRFGDTMADRVFVVTWRILGCLAMILVGAFIIAMSWSAMQVFGWLPMVSGTAVAVVVCACMASWGMVMTSDHDLFGRLKR